MNRFDKVAGVWEANPRRLKSAQDVYVNIAKKIDLDKNMKVADLGTGTGLLLIHILPHIKEIDGYDNSAEMMKMLKEKLKTAEITNVKTYLFDADFDEFQDSGYDLMVSSMTFHHIQKVNDFFKKIYSATAEGGQIAIADLETEDGSFHSDMYESIKHLGFDKNEIKQMIVNAGFKNVEVETIFSIPKDGKEYPIFLATGKK